MAVSASQIAKSLQKALDDWEGIEGDLRELDRELRSGRAEGAFPFSGSEVLAPLPRAYQWLDGSAYPSHAQRIRSMRGQELPDSFYESPHMYQGCSNPFLSPQAAIGPFEESEGLDFEAEVAVVTRHVPRGTPPEEALPYVALIVLINDISLRGLTAHEFSRGFGFLQSKPPCSMSPLALTPDEFGDLWSKGRLHLPLQVSLNGRRFGAPNAGEGMFFSFAELIAHACRTRDLCAGTLIGSGTVSNADAGRGCCCIAEQRALEISSGKKAEECTPWLLAGDRVRIEILGENEASYFGAIDQLVV